MRGLTPFLCVLCCAATLVAQQQESGMLERIQNPKLEANRMQNVSFEGGSGLRLKSFNTGAFTGSKAAGTGEFKTKSFLGIRNPWFGTSVYKTETSAFANRDARESREAFTTSPFAVKENSSADIKSNLTDEKLPNSVRPRDTVLPTKAQGAMDRFSQNLEDDLTIDEVRDLLNKGKQNR